MIFELTLALVQALMAQAALLEHTRPADRIGALCANKPVALTTYQELLWLHSLAPDSCCSPAIKEALSDLVALMDSTRADLCSVESIIELRVFYAKHLDTSSWWGKRRERLPKSLKRFALAYGMQMSNLCKKQMVKVLTGEGRSLLDNSEFRLLKRLTSDGSPIIKLLDGLTGPGELLLPGDLAILLRNKPTNDEDSHEPEKLYLQTSTGPVVEELQMACSRHFRPVYMPLVRPIVELANMGFNYKDKPLRCDIKCPPTAKELGQWSRLVFLCESLANIQIVGSPPAEQGQTEGSQEKIVRILTEQEAAEIRAKLSSDETTEVTPVPPEKELRGEPVEMECEIIYDKDDTRLVKAIRAFKTSRSEEETRKKRMAHKGLIMLRKQFTQANIRLMISANYKSLLNRAKSSELLQPSNLLRFMDDVVEYDSKILDNQVSLSEDELDEITETFNQVNMIVAAALVGVLILGLLTCFLSIVALAGFALPQRWLLTPWATNGPK